MRRKAQERVSKNTAVQRKGAGKKMVKKLCKWKDRKKRNCMKEGAGKEERRKLHEGRKEKSCIQKEKKGVTGRKESKTRLYI